MKRSTDRILTTHVGSLIRPAALREFLSAKEAGKSVAYGKMSEEEALKLVTINPATMLHVDKRVGSIKVGKDADLVLWSADPLSIYAVAEKTYVDGIPYWDIDKDAAAAQIALSARASGHPGRRAHDRRRLAGKGLVGRARGPIDRVLQHPGHRIIVFGTDEQ